ncbi:MAG: response regulator transcription factor [Chloroflexi bacterium]|nr:response regulator transcription factor [Chloroflexota bacterium]
MELRERSPQQDAANAMSRGVTQILVVDDEEPLVSMMGEWLTDEGFHVDGVLNGADALRVFFDRRPSLVISDLRMKGMDGFQLITRIREMSEVPILILSALGEDEHVVRGLDLGADEYLTKPVSRTAFLARVRSMLRRNPTAVEPTVFYRDAALSIDYLKHSVSVNEKPVALRPLEYRLLTCLVRNRERMVSHVELMDQVWGPGNGSADSLKWYVSALRAKIEKDPQNPRLILNLRGQGYRYVQPEG